MKRAGKRRGDDAANNGGCVVYGRGDPALVGRLRLAYPEGRRASFAAGRASFAARLASFATQADVPAAVGIQNDVLPLSPPRVLSLFERIPDQLPQTFALTIWRSD